MQPTIYYCYDAYCGWCYGFSPVIKKISEEWKHRMGFEVLSGGMIPKEAARPVSSIAGYISEAYKTVEERTGIRFGEDLQYSLNYEGRDLTDDEAYRHLLVKYGIPEETFYSRLNSEAYIEKAKYEFSLCKQLQVTGFPQVLLQVADQKFYLLSKGYTDYETLNARFLAVWEEINKDTENN